MGGWGSGRRPVRRKCEQLLSLDVRRLAREGLLRPGSSFARSWSYGGEPAGSIGVTVGADDLRLRYTWTPYDQQPRQLDYWVAIVRTRCRYGGVRPWFRCPRCHSRRAVLYGISGDGRFGCRYCMRLAYSSEAESVGARITRRLHKLQARIGEEGEKPKWMRLKTFDRICDELERLDNQWGATVLGRLLQRFGP
jgi:hypothetical protein